MQPIPFLCLVPWGDSVGPIRSTTDTVAGGEVVLRTGGTPIEFQSVYGRSLPGSRSRLLRRSASDGGSSVTGAPGTVFATTQGVVNPETYGIARTGPNHDT